MGELRALRWGDVDFAARRVHVRRNYTSRALGDPKSGKVRSVPLIDQAIPAFDRLSRRERFTDRDDLVFCSPTGGYVDDSRLRKRYFAALERAGLKRLRFHDLRHTFGTLAVQAFPLTDVMAYMGHADISTTMVYVHTCRATTPPSGSAAWWRARETSSRRTCPETCPELSDSERFLATLTSLYKAKTPENLGTERTSNP